MSSSAQIAEITEVQVGRQIEARLLRTRDAAHYLGIGEKALRQLIVEGSLPYVQLQPGNSPFLLDRRDLDKFIDTRKIQPR